MLVRIKNNLKVSPLAWHHRLIGKNVILDVEQSDLSDSYSVRDWERFVSPFAIEYDGLDGLIVPKSNCEPIVYKLVSIDKNHLIFKSYGISKPVHVFVVPEMTANSETTYIMDKIKDKPLKEVIQILLDSGFEIYTKFRAGEEV